MTSSRRSPLNSITGLALFTFTLAILPLVIALLTSTIYVNQLNQQGQKAIQQATIVANASQQMAESLIAMERSSRQYSVLLDQELFNVYLESRSDFDRSLQVLNSLPSAKKMASHLAKLRVAEESIYQGLQTVLLGTDAAAKLLSGFTEINAQARVIRNEGEKMIAEAIVGMQNSSARANKMMLWQLAGLLPVLAFATFMVIVFVLKPIRHLDRAIRRLGRGELDMPIVVSGSRDLQELGESLDWMRQRTKELENQKTLFLRHMSHELKTPLTSLREGSELLSEGVIGPLNEEQAEVAQLLKRNCLRLQEQIENLLKFSISQSQQLSLELSSFRVDQLFINVLQGQQLALKSREVRLITDLEPIVVTADREKLQMVMDNLITNAIKYSPIGGELRVSVKPQAKQIKILVTDMGPGIPAEEQQLVFDAFFQGATPPDSVVKGTGIGLSICRSYTQLHGGNIFVDNDTAGSTLCVIIPQQQNVTQEVS